MEQKLYACDACRYLFIAETKPVQCPDCGKFKVRIDTEDEIKEFVSWVPEVDDEWTSDWVGENDSWRKENTTL